MTIDELREIVYYSPQTGKFRYRKNRKPALYSLSKNGRTYGTINGQKIWADEAAWAMTYEEWPDFVIRHVNGIRHDNRIKTLRPGMKIIREAVK